MIAIVFLLGLLGVPAQALDGGLNLLRALLSPGASGPAVPGVQWLGLAPGEKVYGTEPETSVMRRMGVGVLSVLPCARRRER